MKNSDFERLCESIQQAGEIRKGLRKPSRVFHYTQPNVKSIRERLGLTQARFAALMGVSSRTLQHWEQGRREQAGPAKSFIASG